MRRRGDVLGRMGLHRRRRQLSVHAPHVDIAKGASVELEVTVDVPGGKHCSLKNTAVMTFPIAPTRYNGDASDDFASATAKIPAKGCEKPERPQCEPGPNEFRSESGACVCKPGFVRDAKGQCAGTSRPRSAPMASPCRRAGAARRRRRNASRDRTKCATRKDSACASRASCVTRTDAASRHRALRMRAKQKGWLWNDKTKNCTPPSDPASDRRKRGWIWDGQRCTPLSTRPMNARREVGCGPARGAYLRLILPMSARRRAGSGTRGRKPARRRSIRR